MYTSIRKYNKLRSTLWLFTRPILSLSSVPQNAFGNKKLTHLLLNSNRRNRNIKLCPKLFYLGLTWPRISNRIFPQNMFLMSNFPASSTEATVVPLALILSGRPRMVGTVVSASKNIMLLLKLFLPPLAKAINMSITLILSTSSFNQLMSSKLRSLNSLPNIFTETAPEG